MEYTSKDKSEQSEGKMCSDWEPKISELHALVSAQIRRQNEELRNDFYLSNHCGDSGINLSSYDNGFDMSRCTAMPTNGPDLSQNSNVAEWVKFNQFCFILRRLFVIAISILEDTMPVTLSSLRTMESTLREAVAVVSILQEILTEKRTLVDGRNTLKINAVDHVRCCIARVENMTDKMLIAFRCSKLDVAIPGNPVPNNNTPDEVVNSLRKSTLPDSTALSSSDELKQDIHCISLDLRKAFDNAIILVEADGGGRHKCEYLKKVQQVGELVCALSERKAQAKDSRTFREFMIAHSCFHLSLRTTCCEKCNCIQQPQHAGDYVLESDTDDDCSSRHTDSEKCDSISDDLLESEQCCDFSRHFKCACTHNCAEHEVLKNVLHEAGSSENCKLPHSFNTSEITKRRSDIKRRACDFACQFEAVTKHIYQKMDELIDQLRRYPSENVLNLFRKSVNEVRVCVEKAFTLADHVGFTKHQCSTVDEEFECDSLLCRLIDLSSRKLIRLIRVDPPSPPLRRSVRSKNNVEVRVKRRFARVRSMSENDMKKSHSVGEQGEVGFHRQQDIIGVEKLNEKDIIVRLNRNVVRTKTENVNVSDRNDIIGQGRNCVVMKITDVQKHTDVVSSRVNDYGDVLEVLTVSSDNVREHELSSNSSDLKKQFHGFHSYCVCTKRSKLRHTNMRKFIFILLLVGLVVIYNFIGCIQRGSPYVTLYHCHAPPT